MTAGHRRRLGLGLNLHRRILKLLSLRADFDAAQESDLLRAGDLTGREVLCDNIIRHATNRHDRARAHVWPWDDNEMYRFGAHVAGLINHRVARVDVDDLSKTNNHGHKRA